VQLLMPSGVDFCSQADLPTLQYSMGCGGPSCFGFSEIVRGQLCEMSCDFSFGIPGIGTGPYLVCRSRFSVAIFPRASGGACQPGPLTAE
jgi:hypothetical protein